MTSEPPESPARRLAEQYRAELLARDARALRLQTRSLLAVIRRLDTRITALAEVLAERRAAGLSTSPHAIVRLDAFRELRTHAVAELGSFSAGAARLITALEVENVERAAREARALVEASFPPSVTWAVLSDLGIEWAAVDAGALRSLVGRLADGSPLHSYLEARIVRGSMREVVTTLTTGLLDNPRVTARALRTRFAGGMASALRISRTETLRAYRDSARETYAASPRLVRGYRRHEALDDRCCAACWLMDGVLYETSSEMEEHVQGRGYLSPELVPWREIGIDLPDEPVEPTGREIFERLPEERQRAIIGNDTQFELLRSGRIGLSDLVQRSVHPDFGAQLTQASARASLARSGTLSRLPSTQAIESIASLVTPAFDVA